MNITQSIDCFDEYSFCYEGFGRTYIHAATNHVKAELQNACHPDVTEGMDFNFSYILVLSSNAYFVACFSSFCTSLEMSRSCSCRRNAHLLG